MLKVLARRSTLAAALVAAVIVVSTGVAVATTLVTSAFTDPEGRFHGCVSASSGTLRVVTEAEGCKRTETEIVWNQVGPAGPQGETGPAGPAGPKGDDASIAAIGDLDGIACTVRDRPGTVAVAGNERGLFSILWFCVAPDDYEPNASVAAAWNISSRCCTDATLTEGDEDWYDLGSAQLRSIYLVGQTKPTALKLDVYRNGALIASNLSSGYTGNAWDNTDNLDGQYVVRVYGPRDAYYLYTGR